MPARTIAESIKFRERVEAALADGVETPTEVLEWIEKHKDKGEAVPSLPTIVKIMGEFGYKKGKWSK